MTQPSVRLGLAAAAALALSAPSLADAQTTPAREYGIDAGLQFGLGDAGFTTLDVPAQRLRIGFFRTPTVSIEPYGALSYQKPEGGDGFTSIGLGTGLLYHLSTDRSQSQTYIRPFVDLSYLNGGDDSDTQLGVGAGVGIKLPWQGNFAWRLEANVGYAFESDLRGSGATLGVGAGLSFFR